MFKIGLMVKRDDMETIGKVEQIIKSIPGNEEFVFDLANVVEGVSVVGDTFPYSYVMESFEHMDEDLHVELDDTGEFKDIDPETYTCFIVEESGEEYSNLLLGTLKCGKTFKVKLDIEVVDTFIK